MSAPASTNNPLENLLTEALTARADLVEAEDLTPATPPAVVVPLHRRRPVIAGAVTAGLVAAAAVIAVAVGGDDATRTDQEVPIATESASPTPERPAPPLIENGKGLFAEIDPGYVDPGTEVSYDGGATAVVSADSSTLTLTDPVLGELSADLVVAADGTPNRLSSVELDLGQAGSGYLVRRGDDDAEAELEVLVPLDDGTMVSAPVVPSPAFGDVPFGTGYTDDGRAYVTWLSADGGPLFTRVAQGDPAENRFEVYRWGVTGPGEGGEGPNNPNRDLEPERVGSFCIDFAAGDRTSCAGADLVEDEVGTVPAGRSVTYPEGFTARIVRSSDGDGYALRITENGSPLAVDLPDAVQPYLSRQLLNVDGVRGWLITDELGGGDFSKATAVSLSGGDLVVNVNKSDVVFGSGFGDKQVRTYSAGDGAAVYTAVYDEFGGETYDLYSWNLASEEGPFEPFLVGSF